MRRRYHVLDGLDPKGVNRVYRGGSWKSNARNVRAAYRNRNDPANRWNNLGFRLARAQTRAGRPAPDPVAVRSVRTSLCSLADGEDFLGYRCAGRVVDTTAKAHRWPALSPHES